MKKLTAMLLVMVMMVMGFCAHAELTYKTDGTKFFNIGTNRKGEKVNETIYYLKVMSESGEYVRLEVTKEEYDKVARAEKDAQKNFFAKVGTAMTFWNPND